MKKLIYILMVVFISHFTLKPDDCNAQWMKVSNCVRSNKEFKSLPTRKDKIIFAAPYEESTGKAAGFLIQDTVKKVEKISKKAFSINLSGGITFSSGQQESFTNYMVEQGYELTGNLNSLELETGIEFKLINSIYLYPEIEFSISKVTIEHSSPFPNSERTNTMLSPGLELRYYYNFDKLSLGFSGGINFNSFTPYNDNYKVKSDGAGYEFSLILSTLASSSMTAGLEVGYSSKPFKEVESPYYNPETDKTYNFGGVFLNGLINFGLLFY